MLILLNQFVHQLSELNMELLQFRRLPRKAPEHHSTTALHIVDRDLQFNCANRLLPVFAAICGLVGGEAPAEELFE